MTNRTQMQKAREFQALHAGKTAFLMPNAWDAGSAILLAQAGFKTIGTTSASRFAARCWFSNWPPKVTK